MFTIVGCTTDRNLIANIAAAGGVLNCSFYEVIFTQVFNKSDAISPNSLYSSLNGDKLDILLKKEAT